MTNRAIYTLSAALMVSCLLVALVGCRTPLTNWSGPSYSKSYDEHFIGVVSNQWYQLLRPVKDHKIGVVVIRFKQTDDGKITDMKVVKSTTDDLLASMCEKAVLEPAPYERWSPAMLEAIGKPYRTITFTFHYY